MTVRRLDANGEIVTSGSQFLTGAEEIAQTIVTRLRLFLGEYFRDITDGTPWFQNILVKSGSLESKDAAIKIRIVRTPNVIGLTRYNSDYDIDSRTYSISGEVLTPFGQVTFGINEEF